MVRIILGCILWICLSLGFQSHGQVGNAINADHPIIGKWVRSGPMGPVAFNFLGSGIVEGDFGDNGDIDVRSTYTITGDTIRFVDVDGQACQGIGTYKLDLSEFYLAFDMLEDMCGGRIKATAGFWTRPDHQTSLDKLAELIDHTGDPDDHVERGRVYLALGESEKARSDFNIFINSDSTNARVFMNRAATNFPYALGAVISDCDKALSLNPDLKNAYFMRGIALYETGHHRNACEDFEKAIELGFEVLREAEKSRCTEYWNK